MQFFSLFCVHLTFTFHGKTAAATAMHEMTEKEKCCCCQLNPILRMNYQIYTHTIYLLLVKSFKISDHFFFYYFRCVSIWNRLMSLCCCCFGCRHYFYNKVYIFKGMYVRGCPCEMRRRSSSNNNNYKKIVT